MAKKKKSAEGSPSKSFDYDVIHTIDARTHLFLEVTSDYLKLNPDDVFQSIQSMAAETRRILASKGIKYDHLRTALTPQPLRHEVAFALDYTKATNQHRYDYDALEAIFRAIKTDSSHSILCGDWIAPGRNSAAAYVGALREELVCPGAPYQGRGDAIYFVCINNLSDEMKDEMVRRVSAVPGYVGYAVLNRTSLLKAYLSTFLIRAFLVHKGTVIQGHEDDVSNDEDSNMSCYPLDEWGFKIRSIASTYYGVFLAYKIERPVLKNERDREFAMNSLLPLTLDISKYEVQMDPKKIPYLEGEHPISMQKMGFIGLTADEIAAQVRSRIQANYVYRLSRATNGRTLKFDLMLENYETGARSVCTLELFNDQQLLKIVSITP